MNPDGTRKRRFSDQRAKRWWYATWRSIRFAAHMTGEKHEIVQVVRRFYASAR